MRAVLAPVAGLVAVLVAGAVIGGPATAAPRAGQVTLSGVMGGDLPRLRCAVPAITVGSAASLRAFHKAMAACADRFWAERFAAAGLPYSSPEVTITSGADSVCGRLSGAGAHYCPEQRAIVIRITRHDLRDPFRMNVAHSVAHEWGHHVQQLTGVLRAQEALYLPASEQARRVLSHRLEMQAECYAGVFYSSALKSIGPGIAWDDWLDAVRQAEESEVHGKPRNLAFWQDRGYRGGATGFCNTWTAARAKVG
ncbi:Putative neutral zinc metallopeptidase [Nonomuraea coxensis DSM 45129]|uniref:Neutral zinc metallopeptidase n=1 Tax=Nonomuraea coxensis DSM 45129 TaxID=1122611 RepID=A0ABX8U7C8_9ACTN|nr:neutral zinc metallopeptidase [Nonomuraea coxensis]QYC43598.1 Putative neutral zinc metallopeptidase [Nonomuraea coxensis DSM 45129]